MITTPAWGMKTKCSLLGNQGRAGNISSAADTSAICNSSQSAQWLFGKLLNLPAQGFRTVLIGQILIIGSQRSKSYAVFQGSRRQHSNTMQQHVLNRVAFNYAWQGTSDAGTTRQWLRAAFHCSCRALRQQQMLSTSATQQPAFRMVSNKAAHAPAAT